MLPGRYSYGKQFTLVQLLAIMKASGLDLGQFVSRLTFGPLLLALYNVHAHISGHLLLVKEHFP